ncbi:hypothetical protein BKA62DRAFT_164776 [Auriculariales sp. MPI-PUGE-AT-0066]|nr:hypothetical protein BKA62DRAFT_164776 [Auriculariales sp. MPI-PUGE-AT-0066]
MLRSAIKVNAPHARVPAELWAAVWSYLPITDRLAVTMVSRDWRNMALTTPSLWNEIQYHASTHTVTCECVFCLNDTRNALCGACGRRRPENYHNLSLVKRIISCSGDLPVSTDISIFGNAHAKDIANALKAVSHRLVFLHLALDDARQSREFFSRFKSLTALKSLIILTEAEQDDDDDDDDERIGHMLFSPGLELPVLEHLEVEGPYDINTKISVGCVRYLRVPISNIDDIVLAMSLCPAAKHFHFQAGDTTLDLPTVATCQAVRERLTSAPPFSIRVSDLYETDLSSVLSLLHDASLPSLSLAFRSDSEVDIQAFSIFRDVEDATDISWTYDVRDPMLHTLQVTSSKDISRAITYEPTHTDLSGYARAMWDKIAASRTLLNLRIGSDILVEHLAAIPSMSSLIELTLDCRGSELLFEAFIPGFDTLMDPPRHDLERFPNLRVLRLVGDLSVSTGSIASTDGIKWHVRGYRKPNDFVKLEQLVLVGVTLSGPLCTLDELANCVVIRTVEQGEEIAQETRNVVLAHYRGARSSTHSYNCSVPL